MPLGHRAYVLGRLGWDELGREGCGDLGEQRMLLDGVGEFLNPEVNGAASNALARGVSTVARVARALGKAMLIESVEASLPTSDFTAVR